MDALKVQYRGNEIKYRMEISRIERQEIINTLRRLKNGKRPGTDGMKAEIYRWILDSETLKTPEKCFNCVLCWGSPRQYWRKSRTVRFQNKTAKAKEFRPITLTNVEYKIFMSAAKEKIVQHLRLTMK